MSDGIDLQNILKTGFFTTSRARHPTTNSPSKASPSKASSFIPRTFPKLNRRRPSYPPAPSAEDEIVALEKELGSFVIPVVDEEPQSRGEIDQHPIIVEVFEYNPERRFVVLPGSSSVDESGAEDKAAQKRAHRRAKSSRTCDKSSKPTTDANAGSRRERSRRREPVPTTDPPSPPPPPCSSSPTPSVERKPHNVTRRKSRQDLPRIETDLDEHEIPSQQHHRSRSDAGGARPSFSPGRHRHDQRHDHDHRLHRDHPHYGHHQHHHHHHHHHMCNDEYLSPNVSKSSLSAREKTHHDRGERLWDEKRWRSLTPSMDGRSGHSRLSSYEPRDSRHWDEHRSPRSPRSPRSERSGRSSRRESFGSPPRAPRDKSKSGARRNSSSRRHRDSSWSSVEGFLRNSRHRIRPVPTDDGRSSLGVPGEDFRGSRSLSRVRTMPVSSAQAESFMGSEPDRGFSVRSSSTFPVNRSEDPRDSKDAKDAKDERDKETRDAGDQKKTLLPYPDDDEAHEAWLEGVSTSGMPRQLQPGASISSMPQFPPVIDENEVPAKSDQDSSAGPSPAYLAPPIWLRSPVDGTGTPNPEDSRIERPVGSYRRYSDAQLNGGNDDQEPRLPECFRTTAAAGLMDWITLPRTDFNICPDCYGDVFASTQYRTQFQPLLRPTIDPIACDFGSSPWYRIAWLLTLKEQKPDLQLFYKLAGVLASSRNRPCPGSLKALEFWYVIKDPFTRRAVPDFTVCHECTSVIEALFPVLGDVFGPQDAWQEPNRSVCALHFTPDRKEFPLYFDAFEMAAELAFKNDRPADIGDLCMTLNRIGTFHECRESRRVNDGYWYSLTFLPEFTVCGECFDNAVRPQQHLDGDDDSGKDHGVSSIARSFHPKPHKLPVATCQLYSPRMRDVFKWACRRNDREYLEARVKERRKVEEDLHAKFVSLIREGRRNRWTEEQIDKLAREWRKWE